MVIRRVVITAKAMKEQKVVEEYEFVIDEWYQQEWWRNTLALVESMLASYAKYSMLTKTTSGINDNHYSTIAFRKSYGNCESFFKPCKYTAHCSSKAGQDLQALGFEQKVYDKNTKTEISLRDARQQLGLEV
jgi:hypothetical protein